MTFPQFGHVYVDHPSTTLVTFVATFVTFHPALVAFAVGLGAFALP